eukprot:jgi/Tetstr1/441924/TSEL_030131.t1
MASGIGEVRLYHNTANSIPVGVFHDVTSQITIGSTSDTGNLVKAGLSPGRQYCTVGHPPAPPSPSARASAVGVAVPAGAVVVGARRCDGAGAVVDARRSLDWEFRCCDGGCGRTYQRPAPLCTHVNHGMESDDPAVAAMHLAYAATFAPSVYVRSRAASAEAAEGAGADAAADGVPPAVVDAHRRAAKLTAMQELRRARQALDTADLGMVSDAAAALPVLEGLHPPPAPTDPEDLDAPSWRLWVNRFLAGRCHSRTAAFLASGTVFALHKDDPAAREERAKTGELLRVRPLGVGSVLVRLASAHALVHVGADAREAMDPVQLSFQSGAGWETAYMSMRVALQLFGGRGTGGKGLLPLDIRNAFNELERIASFGTLGYGCDHEAMPLLVVCAVRQTGFLSRMMPPSELDPFLAAVDAANISAAFSLLATEAEHNKLAADRASSAPVQGVHRYYPFVVEDRGRLGKSVLTVVYIFTVLLV